MALQAINVGSAPNDGTGDKLRAAGQKINQNFQQLAEAIGDLAEAPGGGGAAWHTGEDVPGGEIGADGDFYLRVNGDVYGPKTAGSWGSAAFSLKGPGGSGGAVAVDDIAGAGDVGKAVLAADATGDALAALGLSADDEELSIVLGWEAAEVAEDGSYTLVLSARRPVEIVSLTHLRATRAAGKIKVAINGTAVTGLEDLEPGATKATAAASGANLASAGDTITLDVYGGSDVTGLVVQLNAIWTAASAA